MEATLIEKAKFRHFHFHFHFHFHLDFQSKLTQPV